MRNLGRSRPASHPMTPDDAEFGLLATTRYLPRLRLERSELLNQHRWMLGGNDHECGWEERWVRDEGYMKLAVDTLADCLQQAGMAAAEIAHFVLPAPLPRINEAAARRLGIAPEVVVSADHETVGDLGNAQALAMLDSALRSAAPGALVLVGAFGSGCDALLLRRQRRRGLRHRHHARDRRRTAAGGRGGPDGRPALQRARARDARRARWCLRPRRRASIASSRPRSDTQPQRAPQQNVCAVSIIGRQGT